MLQGAKRSVEYVCNNHSKILIYFYVFSFKIVVVMTSYFQFLLIRTCQEIQIQILFDSILGFKF